MTLGLTLGFPSAERTFPAERGQRALAGSVGRDAVRATFEKQKPAFAGLKRLA